MHAAVAALLQHSIIRWFVHKRRVLSRITHWKPVNTHKLLSQLETCKHAQARITNWKPVTMHNSDHKMQTNINSSPVKYM